MIALAALASTELSAAQLWEPRNMSEGAIPIVMVEKERIPSVSIGALRVVLDETRLKDVARRFDAPIGHRGDAAESLDWICLTGGDATSRWVLWIESGEIHGGAAGAFQWRGAAIQKSSRSSSTTMVA